MALITLLFVLGVCGSLASGDAVKSAPPEDLDVSGDDEDFSGSGMEIFFVDADSKEVYSTPISHLVPTVQVSTAPEVAQTEEVTQPSQTTEPHDPIIDIFNVDPVEREGSAPEPTTLQTSTVESVHDVEKRGHHTTALVTSSPEKPDVMEETTARSVDVEKPFVFLEETTTSTPDEGDLDGLVPEMTTPEGAVQHVDHPETTSGLTSTPYAENEETTVEPVDNPEIPVFVDSVEATTVTDDSHTSKHHHGGHHHHHHTHHPHNHTHHHHHTTTPDPITPTTTVSIPLDELDLFEMEKPVYVEPEDDQTEATTPPPHFGGDKHHDHKHHHHTTTPEAANSSLSEQSIVHGHDSKGRKVNVPHAVTTAAPAQSEEEEPIASTVQNNRSLAPVQDEDAADSAEEESGNGPVEGVDSTDIFFVDSTVPGLNRMEPPGDGSADASHGIMDRKELLAAIIAGGLAGLVFAASLVAFVLYRMKKKDEGSYSLEEPKQSNGGYQKPREQREFYA